VYVGAVAKAPQMIRLDLLVSCGQAEVPQVKLIRKMILRFSNAFRFFFVDSLLQIAGYVECRVHIVSMWYRGEDCLLNASEHALDDLKRFCIVDSALKSHFGFINSGLLMYFKLVRHSSLP
jgi:hypothetical protein